MKYVVFLGDGMSDHPVAELNNKTPLDVANKPNMDLLAKKGYFGLAKTVPDHMPPGSDVANLSVFGYDPEANYSGRSPLEAVNMGIELNPNDITLRCNFVTLSDEANIEDCVMDDYCAGEISTEESGQLIAALNNVFKNDTMEFFCGKSYRHCLVCRDFSDGAILTPPHDISKQPVKNYLPDGANAELFLDIMRKSRDVLKNHEVNLKRKQNGLNPANSIWLWGEGRKPALATYREKYGISGSVISAVDLIQGIGLCAGLEVVKVEGATGNYNTNYLGKAEAAINALKSGKDFVYIHVEAPDECGHRNEIKEKVYSIEKIDSDIIGPVLEYLDNCGEDYKVLLMPDHPTPLSLMTHTSEPVPFVLFKKGDDKNNNGIYNEKDAAATGVFVPNAYKLMDMMVN